MNDMNKKDLTIARELKKRLAQVVDVVNLIVFGSRARGDNDEYSDMDISIELRSVDRQDQEKIADITWEVGFENGIVISPIVFTTDEIRNSPLRASPFLHNIAEEGVKL
jgi:predicted nucleotidyltransferase